MGFIRKAFIVSTAGAGRIAVKPNSKKDRTANAAEKMNKRDKKAAKKAR